MKKYIYLAVIVILSGCTSLNRVNVSNDIFRDSRSIHMRQEIKSVSDRSRPSIAGAVEYTALLDWFGEVRGNSQPELILTIGIETSVKKDLLEPEVYLMVNSEKHSLLPVERRLENFGREVNSRSEETSEVKDDKGKTTTTVVTSTNTQSSINPVRYVQYRYLVDRSIAKEIAQCEFFTIRFYLGDEGVTSRYKHAEKMALRKFFRKYLEL